MSYEKPTPEEILELARKEERTAKGAESIRRNIRLGEKGVWRTTRKIFFRQMLASAEEVLSGGERDALYEALGTVRDDAAARARELRAKVVLVNEPKGL